MIDGVGAVVFDGLANASSISAPCTTLDVYLEDLCSVNEARLNDCNPPASVSVTVFTAWNQFPTDIIVTTLRFGQFKYTE